MKIFFDDKNGLVVPDGKVTETALAIVKAGKDITVGSDLLVTAIRLALIENKIDYKSVVFVFNGKNIILNEKYQITKYPTGFCDVEQNILRNIRLEQKKSIHW